jgi:hypothetical protein
LEGIPAQIGRFVSDKATKKWVKSLVNAKLPDAAYDDIANYWKNVCRIFVVVIVVVLFCFVLFFFCVVLFRCLSPIFFFFFDFVRAHALETIAAQRWPLSADSAPADRDG